MLAGALAARPSALVLDEPFAGLDERARAELTAALMRLRAERGLTLVCVSHDRDLPPALVDREIELTGGRDHLRRPGSRDATTTSRRGTCRDHERPPTAEPPRPQAARAGAHVPAPRAGRLAGAPAVAGHEADRRRPSSRSSGSIAPTWLTLGVIARVVLDRPPRRPHPARRVPAPAARPLPRRSLFGLLLNSLSTTPPGRAPGPAAGQPRRARRVGAVPRARHRARRVGRARRVDDPLGAVAPALVAPRASAARAPPARRRVDRRDRARAAVPAAARRRDAHARRGPAAAAPQHRRSAAARSAR